jgi:DNA polymerase elongation subunit (family B)
MKAFGYDNISEDVDVVYPKTPIQKDNLEKIIQMYLQVPMNKICKESDVNTEELLSIQDMFEEAHSQQDQESNTLDSDVHANQEMDENNALSWKKKLGYKKNKIKGNVNIVEYLLEDSHTREEQINALDILLLSKLPALEGDKVTFIGSTFINYGKKEPHKNHCIVLGDCDDVKGVEIVSVDTEKQVLLEWTKLIQKENPDIIIGYNIFGFDYEFMFQRSKETECVSEFLKLSRDKNHISKKDTHDSNVQIMNTKVALASGEYDLRYYNMLGRLQIDMYTYFRRDFNLSSYKLDDVAGQFISDSIKKVECTTDSNGKEITKLYSKNLMGLHVDDFIHIELSSFTSDYFKNGKKFIVRDIE